MTPIAVPEVAVQIINRLFGDVNMAAIGTLAVVVLERNRGMIIVVQ